MAVVGTAIIDMKADVTKLVSGMDKAEKSIKKTVGGIKTAIISMATAYVGIQGVKAFTGMINDSLDAADATGKLSKKLGLTTNALSEYQYAAGFAAVSNGELNAGLSAMIRRLNNFQRDGGGAAKKAMQELGISAEYAKKHFTNTDIAFKEILKRLEKMPDGFKKTAIAQDIFSKSASGILRMTATDLKKYSEEAQKIGISIPQNIANMAAAYHDEMDQMDAQLKGFKQTIAFSVAAPMNAAAKTALEMSDSMFGSSTTDKMKNFEDIAVTSIADVVYAIGFIKDAFTGVKLVITTIEHAFYAMAWGINKVFDILVTDNINRVVDAYNAVADLLGKEKLSNVVNLTTIDLTKKMVELRKEADDLTNQIANMEGRKNADEFVKKFKENLAVVKEEAKKVKKEIDNNSGNDSTNLKADEKKLSTMKKLEEAYQKSFKIQEDLFTLQEKRNAQASNTQNENEIAKIQEALDLVTSDTDKINEKYLEMYDVIQGVFSEDQMKVFFDKWNEELKGIEKESKKYEGIGSKDWTAGLTGQVKDIANIGNAFADLAKEQETWSKYSKENATNEKDTNTHLQNQIGLYGNIAGAVVNMAEEGSAAAKVAQVAQTALAVAQGVTAILNQGQGDPYTAIARMVAMAAMVASTLSSLSGAGGVSINAAQSANAAEMDALDATNKVITDRLDQQIALLESIDRNGSAASLETKLAETTFKHAYDKWKLEVFADSRLGYVNTAREGDSALNAIADTNAWEQKLGFNVLDYNDSGSQVKIDTNSLKQGNNLILAIADIVNGEFKRSTPFGQSIAKDVGWGEAGHTAFLTAIDQSIADVQGYLNDWAIETIDTISDLTEASDTLKESFDSITGSDFYKNKELEDAFKSFDKLAGNKGYAGYLQEQIGVISKAEKFLTDDKLGLLLSKNTDDFEAQMRLVAEFSAITGKTFADGAEGVLNFIDSIELVTEALTTSTENIKSFLDSFKTDTQITKDLFYSSGETLAQTYDELKTLFDKLSNDQFGLTDTDLELLNANKAYLEELASQNKDALQAQSDALSETLTSITSDISSFNSILGNLSSIINKLNGAIVGTSYTMQDYYDSMRNTLALSNGSDTQAYQTSLSSTISKSSALFDASNFSSQYDQQFAQAVASNQFAGMEDKALTQIDYLEKIEENTRGQLAILSSQISNATDLISNFSTSSTESPIQTVLEDVYKTVLGVNTPDTAGLAYWTNQIQSGNLDITKAGVLIGASAVTTGNLSRGDYVKALYEKGLSRTPSSEEVDYWANQSTTKTYDLAPLFKQLDSSFTYFANGGIVTSPTMGMIGEAGYPEAVIPLKNPSDPLQTNELLKELRELKQEMKTLTTINEFQAKRLDRIDKRDDLAQRTA